MTWIIEAIEKAALERARQQLMSGVGAKMLGFIPEQISAFDRFFQERVGEDPRDLSGAQIIQKLRERFR